MKQACINGLIRPCLLLLPVWLLTGCQRAAPTLAGTWQGQATQSGGTALMKYVFAPDGTETLTVVAGPLTMTVNGTYTVKDQTLTQTLTQAVQNGKPYSLDAKKKAPIVETFTLDGDTLTLTKPQATLHRVKN